MSLIALTDRVHTGRSMVRTLLLLVVITGAIIVGLLAMHSLNAHTATDAGHQTTATDEPCADCGSGHSTMLAMACVLALLATVLLLVRPSAVMRWLSILPRPRPSVASALFTGPALRPPSLTVLCISRT